MFYIVLAIFLAVAGFVVPKFLRAPIPGREYLYGYMRTGVRAAGILLALLSLSATSFVLVGQDQAAHLSKIYFGGNLKDGAIIAVSGEKGPQAEILPPGFHFIPLLRVIYDVSLRDVVEITQGHYGFLMARDGRPLLPDQAYADAFEPAVAARMVSDAAYFLTNNGQKGPQTSVLTPGKYRLNRMLWKISVGEVTEIPQGFVGVVKSNVRSRVQFGNLQSEKPSDCSPVQPALEGGAGLTVPLVPVGCIGVWNIPLSPGQYYINQNAYKVTMVDTRVQTWEYKGGYTRRAIDLELDQSGDFTQTQTSQNIPVPDTAVDQAVFVKVEGWDVPQELRVLIQVTPALAAFVVASVGGMEQVETRVLTPAIRSVVRNVVGGIIKAPAPVLDNRGRPVLGEDGVPVMRIVARRTVVLDLIENRDVLEQNVEELIRPEGLKAGVDIKEVRFGEPAIPPELLLARRREQLAQQLRKAFVEERNAQTQRIATEQARATADQQKRLVESQIEVKRSEQLALALRNEGRGERDKLRLIAEGQKAQVEVLGPDRVVELRRFELIITKLVDFFQEHPEVLTTALSNAHKFVPDRVFTLGGASSGGNNLAGAAAVLGDFMGGGRSEPRGSDANSRTEPNP